MTVHLLRRHIKLVLREPARRRCNSFVIAMICLLALAAGADAASSSRRLSQKAHKQCLKEGGRVKVGGILAHEYCVHDFKDAGKVCRDGSECDGKVCYWPAPDGPTRRDPPPKETVTGQCAANDDGFGCMTVVKDGKIAYSMCVD